MIKKGIDCHDRKLYWSKSIKYTIQWFTFIFITKHTSNIIKPNKGIIHSLLKLFTIFQLRLFDDRYKVEAIAIRFINLKKDWFIFKNFNIRSNDH